MSSKNERRSRNRASQPEEQIRRIKGVADVGVWPRPEQMIGPFSGKGERRPVLPGGQNRPSEQDDRQEMQAETGRRGANPGRSSARGRTERRRMPARDRARMTCIAPAVLSPNEVAADAPREGAETGNPGQQEQQRPAVDGKGFEQPWLSRRRRARSIEPKTTARQRYMDEQNPVYRQMCRVGVQFEF